MNNKLTLISGALLVFTVALPQQAPAQGLGEFSGMQALGIGMGAGMAAVDHGKLAKFAVNSAAQAQQALIAQTKAIEQYYALGNKYEAGKQWENAEKCYAYTLQIIAKRDGPGSPKSVPTLRHLATVNVAQNKLDQASSYEKTVLAFTKAGKHADKAGVFKESVCLSNLLVKSAKYMTAEPLLKDSIAVAQAGNIKSPDYRSALCMYNLVLKELKKPEEAAKVEAEIAAADASAMGSASVNASSANSPAGDGSEPATNPGMAVTAGVNMSGSGADAASVPEPVVVTSTAENNAGQALNSPGSEVIPNPASSEIATPAAPESVNPVSPVSPVNPVNPVNPVASSAAAEVSESAAAGSPPNPQSTQGLAAPVTAPDASPSPSAVSAPEASPVQPVSGSTDNSK